MLLVFIMFGADYIERMPIAALTGLMIMVAIGTFRVGQRKSHRQDAEVVTTS